MRRHCPRFTGFSGGMDFDGDAVARFFDGEYRTVSFPHDLAYDRRGFVDRMLSASYAPDRDTRLAPHTSPTSSACSTSTRRPAPS